MLDARCSMLVPGRWMLDAGVVEGDNGRSVALAKTPCFLEGVKFRSKATGCLRPLKCQFGAGCLVDTSARSHSDGVARQELPATGAVEHENAPATPFAEPQGRATRNSRTASPTLLKVQTG
jgi:hypothetical protein